MVIHTVKSNEILNILKDLTFLENQLNTKGNNIVF